MYTHFACGFVKEGRVERRTEQLLRRLARRQGWFVPVSTLLDFLRLEREDATITPAEFASLERRWAWERCGLFARRATHHPFPVERPLPETTHVKSY
jgi:hypothetical protein